MKSNEFKLKLEMLFVEQLWQYIIVATTISIFAWILNKPIEAVMFCITHLIIRPQFEKQYHCGTTALCLFTTLTIAMLGIYTTIPLSISLVSAIPVAIGVCWIGYIVQDRIDLQYKLKPNLKMISESEFISYCKLKGLDNYEIKIARLIIRDDLKGEALYSTMGYSKRQAIRIKKKIIFKLNS